MDQLNQGGSRIIPPGHTPQLVIVQRSHFAAFGLLEEAFADEPCTAVIWDRRGAERGSAFSTAPGDRRGKDRRRTASCWGHAEYVVLSSAHAPRANGRHAKAPAGPGDEQADRTSIAREHFRRDLDAAVRWDVNLLITGGDPFSRRLLAERIHRRSQRGSDPMVVIDRLPSAVGDGCGTWLFEEVADLTWKQQTDLLAFLDNRAANCQGGPPPRLITASDSGLFNRLGSSQFRADLYYRLNMIHVVLPMGILGTLAPESIDISA